MMMQKNKRSQIHLTTHAAVWKYLTLANEVKQILEYTHGKDCTDTTTCAELSISGAKPWATLNTIYQCISSAGVIYKYSHTVHSIQFYLNIPLSFFLFMTFFHMHTKHQYN